MSIDMSQFHQVFFEESAEHLAEMESLLLGLDVAAPEAEDLNAIFRAAHSIKGSSGTFGFSDLAELTHILENLLDKIRKNEIPLRPEMVDAFLETGDLLKRMLEAHQGGAPADPDAMAAMSLRLQQLTDGAAPVPEPETVPPMAAPAVPLTVPAAAREDRAYRIEFIPTAASAKEGVARFIEDLRQLGRLKTLASPPADAPVGFWSLRLFVPVLPESVGEQLDFIAESDAWRVEEEGSCRSDGEEVFGFFADASGLSDDVRGYGFSTRCPTHCPKRPASARRWRRPTAFLSPCRKQKPLLPRRRLRWPQRFRLRPLPCCPARPRHPPRPLLASPQRPRREWLRAAIPPSASASKRWISSSIWWGNWSSPRPCCSRPWPRCRRPPRSGWSMA